MRTRPIQVSSDPVPPVHRAVLLHEAVNHLHIKPDDTVVDATLGGGGHAKEIAAHLGLKAEFIGFDLDSAAIERAHRALQNAKCKVELIESNFRELGSALSARSVRGIDKALFDLGWSSFQLNAGRGFSFNTNGPLLMTYATDSRTGLTAAQIVNLWTEQSLADVFFGWGEDRFARRIARALVERRKVRPFTTAKELAEAIREAVPPSYRHGRIHPATKTFQALRIAVNDELGALTDGLKAAWALLRPGGRIAVISFHSIEDRLVKQYFAELVKSGVAQRISKKPIVPDVEEVRDNPRARSAKLRVIEKKAYEQDTSTTT